MFLIKNRYKINRGFFINFCVLLLFVSMNVYELVSGSIQDLFRKATLLILFACAVCCCFKKINLKTIMMLIICLVTGIVNYKYVGNTMLSNQIIVAIYIFASLLLTDSELNEKTVLFAVYMNMIVIMYRFSVVGMFQRVYNVASNNYISVYLLLPAIVYYTIEEKKEQSIELYTAFFVWIVCLLGMGRGGILCSSLLLIGLLYLKQKTSNINKKFLNVAVAVILIVMILPFAGSIFSGLSNLEIFEKFQRGGVESNSREEIWNNYLAQATKSPFNILFGGDNSHTIAMRQFNGNTHNTYLNIHVHNGIIPLVVILILIIINLIKAIKFHRWIYCLCLFVILLRGFTDIIFWLNLGTPVLFYLLFYGFDDNGRSTSADKIKKILNGLYG